MLLLEMLFFETKEKQVEVTVSYIKALYSTVS